MTTGVTFPISGSLFTGLSYVFSTSAEHPLSAGAILNPAAALHLVLDNARVSISTELGIIRRLLQGGIHEDTELVHEMQAVKQGKRRLVVHVDKADYIASLIRLKRDVAPGMKMTIFGGMESWMVADELAKEDVGVVINPARSFPTEWNSKRIMPGPPLSQDTLPSYLASRGVVSARDLHSFLLFPPSFSLFALFRAINSNMPHVPMTQTTHQVPSIIQPR